MANGKSNILKAAAVSIIALTASLSAARAQDTIIDYPFPINNGTYSTIYGNNNGTDYKTPYGNPANNSLTFNTGASFNDMFEIYGGYSANGIMSAANTLTINSLIGGPDISYIYGGATINGDAKGNQVNITGGAFPATILVDGGKSKASITGQSLNSTDNAIAITGGTFNGHGYYITGGEGDDDNKDDTTFNIAGNSVTISGGSFSSSWDGTWLYGGRALLYGTGSSAEVKGNTVKITGGSFYDNTFIYGGDTRNYGTGTVTVTGNKVYITGGTFAKEVKIYGGWNNNGEVSGNEVHLSGGSFSNSDVFNYVVAGASDAAGAVKNNTVYVSDNVDLSNVYLFAAKNTTGNNAVSGGGNTLVFGDKGKPWNSADNKVKYIAGFDTVKIAAAVWDKPIDIVYLHTGMAKVGKIAIDATKVAFAGIESVNKGDKTRLLHMIEYAGDGLELTGTASTYTIGTTLQGKGTVALADSDNDGNDDTVVYTIDSAKTRSSQPQVHTAAMTSAAKMTALKQGADTAQAALSNLSGSGKTGMQGFAAMGGGTARQETGSHLTLNAVNFTAGMGGTFAAGAAKLTVGGALEAGHGSFKNHFDAGDADPYVNKKGHVNYYGGAVLTEMRWASDWHANANLRAGYAKTEQTAALYNAGTNTAYDVDSGAYYVGTEIGGGKVLGLTDNQSVDLYGKYIYLHQGGDSFEAGGHYDVKGVDSHRLRLGGRYDHGFNKTWGLYAGLAGEYEFDGKGRVMADGAEVLPAKTKGMRGIGELGVKLTPEESGFSMDVNVKGSVGKYRSALFGIDVKYEF